PRSRARGTPANKSRIGVKRPVYVAGFERGVRPLGLWSTLTTLSNLSSTSISSKGAGSAELEYRWRAAARYRVSFTSVDLPEPETPVTQVRSPTGTVNVTPFRLLPRAPDTRNHCSGCGGWRVSGRGIWRWPVRYCPVSE